MRRRDLSIFFFCIYGERRRLELGDCWSPRGGQRQHSQWRAWVRGPAPPLQGAGSGLTQKRATPSGCPSGERLQEQELVVSWEDSRPLAGVPEDLQWKGVFRWLQAWTLAGVGLGPQGS